MRVANSFKKFAEEKFLAEVLPLAFILG